MPGPELLGLSFSIRRGPIAELFSTILDYATPQITGQKVLKEAHH